MLLGPLRSVDALQQQRMRLLVLPGAQEAVGQREHLLETAASLVEVQERLAEVTRVAFLHVQFHGRAHRRPVFGVGRPKAIFRLLARIVGRRLLQGSRRHHASPRHAVQQAANNIGGRHDPEQAIVLVHDRQGVHPCPDHTFGRLGDARNRRDADDRRAHHPVDGDSRVEEPRALRGHPRHEELELHHVG